MERKGSKLVMILELACIDQRVGRELEKWWKSRFDKRPASHSTRSQFVLLFNLGHLLVHHMKRPS